MKTPIVAALALLATAGAAVAAPANSTNQHQRDRADFYSVIPGQGATSEERGYGERESREATTRHLHRRAVAQ